MNRPPDYPTNGAGAAYGTGYRDAQCPHDIKWINGEANMEDWEPSETDINSGAGKYGSCCPEMDIWEANSRATAYTTHPCSTEGQYREVKLDFTPDIEVFYRVSHPDVHELSPCFVLGVPLPCLGSS